LFKILIDTCVWLDLAKDYQQQAILAALEELVRAGDVDLLVPRTVVDEFARNKACVIEESIRSLSSALKRVKEVVVKFGDPRQKAGCYASSTRWITDFRPWARLLWAQSAGSGSYSRVHRSSRFLIL